MTERIWSMHRNGSPAPDEVTEEKKDSDTQESVQDNQSQDQVAKEETYIMKPFSVRKRIKLNEQKTHSQSENAKIYGCTYSFMTAGE